MCGIVGYYSQQKYNIDAGVESLKHRGPDNQHYESYEVDNNSKIVIGHTRLSIIDLKNTSNQPFTSSCNNYIIAFNGEIYNYKKLKKQLSRKGFIFKTESDTEVLLYHFIDKGIEGLNELEGMFAFSIFDRKNNLFFLVRDQLGIKPIYYNIENNELFWSSELKGIWALKNKKNKIDSSCIAEFLQIGYLHEPDTGFINTYKLRAGSYLKINLNKNISEQNILFKYWYPKKVKTSKNIIFNQINKEIEQHLISDVPLGLFFSGGIDSSIIMSKTKNKIDSFIVKADENDSKDSGFTNDYSYAKKISGIFDVELNEIEIDKELNQNDDFLKEIEKIGSLSEEPMEDFTFFSSQLLSKYVSKKGYKVMLSGMGADEIFGGYPRYRLIRYGKYFKYLFKIVMPILEKNSYMSKKVQRFKSYYEKKSYLSKHIALLSIFSKKEVENLLCHKTGLNKLEKKLSDIIDKCPYESEIKKTIYLDIYGFLSHNFLVADKSSMQESLEVRVPLATKKLFELSLSLPEKKMMTISKPKKILRDFLINYLPKKLVDRQKTGFNPPLDSNINALGPDNIKKFLKSNNAYEILNENHTSKIVDEHFMGLKNNTFKIYRFLYFSSWYKANNYEKI